MKKVVVFILLLLFIAILCILVVAVSLLFWHDLCENPESNLVLFSAACGFIDKNFAIALLSSITLTSTYLWQFYNLCNTPPDSPIPDSPIPDSTPSEQWTKVFSEIKTEKKLKKFVRKTQLAENTFLDCVHSFCGTSKSVFILNNDISYWEEWWRHKQKSSLESENNAQENSNTHTHCMKMLNVSQQRKALGFDTFFVRVFLLGTEKKINKSLFEGIADAHEDTFSVFNKVYIDKENPRQALNVGDNDYKNIILVRHGPTGVGLMFAKFCDTAQNVNYAVYLEGSDEYKKITTQGFNYIQKSVDIRNFNYKAILLKIADKLRISEAATSNQTKTSIGSDIINLVEDRDGLNHNTMIDIKKLLW